MELSILDDNDSKLDKEGKLVLARALCHNFKMPTLNNYLES